MVASSACNGLLPWHEVPEDTREKYILTGYRRPNKGEWLPCLASAFSWHNETINIWTHLLPAFYFIYFALVAVQCEHTPQNSLFAFYGYLLAVCSLFLVSSAAHLCTHCHFLKDIFFMMDYSAISFYGVGASIAVFAYSRPKREMLVDTEETFLIGIVLLAIAASWTSCWTRVSNSNLGHLIRTLSYAAPFVFGSMPCFERCMHDIALPSNSSLSSLDDPLKAMHTKYSFIQMYVWHFVLMAFAGIVNVSRIPERWFPGAFDMVGHSHQWFHVLIFLSIRQQFWFTVSDICLPHRNYVSMYGHYINGWYLLAAFTVTLVTLGFIVRMSFKNIHEEKEIKEE
jgi:predicted membrane channel-forming protein YqfA (hemolysin III family)